mmetsp:Transcript_31980/g.37283  ORF Transcript_31980/g.37283 Transcript_31980/m.37283 type:complete len:317 (+) Transcript_31980:163-1113(+)
MRGPDDDRHRELIATSISIIDENSILYPQITRNGNDFLPKELSTRLAGDIVVACGVTFCVSPFLSMIDKSIVQRAAGTHTVVQSCIESGVSLIRNPYNYVKSPMFLMMWGVYAATYSTANCLKTIVEYQGNKSSFNNANNDVSSSTTGTGAFTVFALTTVVNSTSTMIKDKFYAARFGTNTAAKLPLITYGLWGLRDCMVIGSSFILPEYTSKYLQDNTDLDHRTALQISQLACPLATQVVAGPTQLLGLDIYNRPLHDLTFKAAAIERIRFQYANFTSILGARIARIAPAYGIGGVGNTYFRDMWRRKVVTGDEI